MSNDMTDTDAKQIMERLERIEENMVRKSDVFQSVLTVQGFTFAIIVGVIVVLNAVIGLGSPV